MTQIKVNPTKVCDHPCHPVLHHLPAARSRSWSSSCPGSSPAPRATPSPVPQPLLEQCWPRPVLTSRTSSQQKARRPSRPLGFQQQTHQRRPPSCASIWTPALQASPLASPQPVLPSLPRPALTLTISMTSWQELGSSPRMLTHQQLCAGIAKLASPALPQVFPRPLHPQLASTSKTSLLKEELRSACQPFL